MSLIIIDGPDDVGKTTLAQRLVALSTGARYFREPSAIGLGGFVRGALAEAPPWPPETWTCAMIAAMLEQDVTIRHHAIRVGTAILDRREASTLAYQARRGTVLEHFVLHATEPLMQPDLWVYVRCRPEVAAQRRAGTIGKDQEAFSDLETQREVFAAYERLFLTGETRPESIRARFPRERVLVVNGEASADAVCGEVLHDCLARGLISRGRV